MSEEQEKMVIDNMALIPTVMKKYSCKHDYQNIFDAGLFGLVKGAKNYQKDRGLKLSTYLCVCIDNEIKMYFRTHTSNRAKANKYTISLDTPIGEGNITLEDTIPDPSVHIEDSIIKKSQLEEIYKSLFILNEKEKFVIIHTYGLFGNEKLNQTELAKELNITQSYACRLIKTAIAKLRKEVNK